MSLRQKGTIVDFDIHFLPMTIEGLAGRFVVAKIRRVSSPPVEVESVTDPETSALGRLADIFRLGTRSQNFADLKAVERMLKEEFDTDPKTEWLACERAVCRALGVERLAPLAFTEPVKDQSVAAPVTYHKATMNDRPYTVAKVGSVLGSPAPTLLTHPSHRESALARLRDVFKVKGRAFRDFLERGQSEAEWRALSAGVQSVGAEATPGVKKVERYKGWAIIEEFSLSGRHVFSALKMDGTECLDYALDLSSREEVVRFVDEREDNGLANQEATGNN